MTTSGRQPLRLMETWRSIFYTPIYVSVAGGFLEREGLDVTFSTLAAGFRYSCGVQLTDGIIGCWGRTPQADGA